MRTRVDRAEDHPRCARKRPVIVVTAFTPVRQLAVNRRLAAGDTVRVGELAQNRQGVFFQYDADYLRVHRSLSPFLLPFDDSLNQAPARPHNGLHGVFADSLPDGWGMLLMDRVFRRRGVISSELTAMDRLSYVGVRGGGALAYTPVSEFAPRSPDEVDVWELGERARGLFDGENDEVLPALRSPAARAARGPRHRSTCRSTNASLAPARVPGPAWSLGSSNSRRRRCRWVTRRACAKRPTSRWHKRPVSKLRSGASSECRRRSVLQRLRGWPSGDSTAHPPVAVSTCIVFAVCWMLTSARHRWITKT